MVRLFLSLWDSYTRALVHYPKLSNALTAGGIFLTSDAIAQKIERAREPEDASPMYSNIARSTQSASPSSHRAPPTNELQTTGSAWETHLVWDLKRSASAGFWGVFWTGAPMVVWFAKLEKWFPGTAMKSVVTKVALNQLTAAPVSNAMFFGWCQWCKAEQFPSTEGLLGRWQGKLDADLLETTQRSLLVWTPLHLFNFAFIPKHLRVLYLSGGLFCWTIYLSMTANREVEENRVDNHFRWTEEETLSIGREGGLTRPSIVACNHRL
mmetsp:Transcript_33861/g.74084  ORF Transcript_33861/g.74084 Transcript_33861/m.74084 type:complete len:267 (+) Transcript_33861:400-1200(+)